MIVAQSVPLTVAQPPRIPPLSAGLAVNVILPIVGSVRFNVPPALRLRVPDVIVSVELTPLDVSMIADAPELTVRLATV